MPIFNYKGLDRTGKEIKSSINVESEVIAKQKLRSQGIMLISIKVQKSEKQTTSAFSFGNGVCIEDLSLFTRQLATLIKAKIQIVEAFKALEDQTENPKLKTIISEIKGKVNEGTSLSAAFGDYPKVFTNVYINMVDAGEQSGNLEIVLLRLADFTDAQMQLKNKIKSALTYPIIMAVIGAIMFGVIFTVVIPKITKIFKNMKREVPLPTKICMWTSDFLINYWWAVIIGIFLMVVAFRKYINSNSGKKRWHRFVLKMPICGEIVTMINVSRFCSTLGTLLNSGVPILTSMKIVSNLIANVHMQAAITQSRTNIQEGASMTEPLIESQLFPTMVTHMIKLGEQAGELEPMLNIVAENYEDQVNQKLNGLTSVLEPIMMLGMGLAVGFVVFAVVMPMMQLNSIR